MNIISFSKSFGRVTLHLDILGALSLGIGFNFFHSGVGFGLSLGPLVFAVSYTPATPQLENVAVAPQAVVDAVHESR